MNIPDPIPERGLFGRTGRVGWPTIVQYRSRDGRLHMCPPRDGPYEVVIHKLAECDHLAATGRLYGAPHACAKTPEITDNRRTS